VAKAFTSLSNGGYGKEETGPLEPEGFGPMGAIPKNSASGGSERYSTSIARGDLNRDEPSGPAPTDCRKKGCKKKPTLIPRSVGERNVREVRTRGLGSLGFHMGGKNGFRTAEKGGWRKKVV